MELLCFRGNILSPPIRTGKESKYLSSFRLDIVPFPYSIDIHSRVNDAQLLLLEIVTD
jgi:hypothetical protein